MIALIFDFFTVFFLAGDFVGWASGSLTSDGFALDGWPALLLFAMIVAYFYIGRKILGGTLWDRILGIARPQPY